MCKDHDIWLLILFAVSYGTQRFLYPIFTYLRVLFYFSEIWLVQTSPGNDSVVIFSWIHAGSVPDGHGCAAVGRKDTFTNRVGCECYSIYCNALVGLLGKFFPLRRSIDLTVLGNYLHCSLLFFSEIVSVIPKVSCDT